MRGEVLEKDMRCFVPSLAYEGLDLYRDWTNILRYWSSKNKHVFLRKIMKYYMKYHLGLEVAKWGTN